MTLNQNQASETSKCIPSSRSAGSGSHIWHPYTRFSQLGDGLLQLIRGEGIHLFDADGRAYIDGISSWWCMNLGHSHPAIVAAIQAQASELQHCILGNLTHPNAEQLARELCELMPDPDRHVLFASDGSCAIEAAVRTAIQYFHNQAKPRALFAALTDPYHGDTMGALSIGYMERFHRAAHPLTFETRRIPAQRSRHDFAEAVASFRALCEKEGSNIAALVLEPLCQGAAGMRMADPEFLRQLDAICREFGILVICDEIAMGFGRTGSMFAFEQAGIDPDIVCMGKGLSAGMLPISTAVIKDSIYQTFADEGERDCTLYHGHTFAGNPIASAAALATLKVYRETDLMVQLSPKASLLETSLEGLVDHPRVKDVRCLGLIGAVELDATPEQMQHIQTRVRDKGILLRPLGSVIYSMMPLTASEDEITHVSEVLCEAIQAEMS